MIKNQKYEDLMKQKASLLNSFDEQMISPKVVKSSPSLYQQRSNHSNRSNEVSQNRTPVRRVKDVQFEMQTECSFQPEINEHSRQIAQQSSLNCHDKLYKQAAQLNHKKYQLSQKYQALEDPECRFQPTTNALKQRDEDTFNRLYGFATKVKAHQDELREYYKVQRDEKEMQECSFKPQKCTEKAPVVGVVKVKGLDAALERQQKARKMKFDKENYFVQNQKERVTKLENIKPFQPQQPLVDSRQVLVYVDVKISKLKTVRIPLKENDNTKEVAKSFAQIHSLNQEMLFTLEELLQQYMEKFKDCLK